MFGAEENIFEGKHFNSANTDYSDIFCMGHVINIIEYNIFYAPY